MWLSMRDTKSQSPTNIEILEILHTAHRKTILNQCLVKYFRHNTFQLTDRFHILWKYISRQHHYHMSSKITTRFVNREIKDVQMTIYEICCYDGLQLVILYSNNITEIWNSQGLNLNLNLKNVYLTRKTKQTWHNITQSTLQYVFCCRETLIPFKDAILSV